MVNGPTETTFPNNEGNGIYRKDLNMSFVQEHAFLHAHVYEPPNTTMTNAPN